MLQTYKSIRDFRWGNGKVGKANKPPDTPECGFSNENCRKLVSEICNVNVYGCIALLPVMSSHYKFSTCNCSNYILSCQFACFFVLQSNCDLPSFYPLCPPVRFALPVIFQLSLPPPPTPTLFCPFMPCLAFRCFSCCVSTYVLPSQWFSSYSSPLIYVPPPPPPRLAFCHRNVFPVISPLHFVLTLLFFYVFLQFCPVYV